MLIFLIYLQQYLCKKKQKSEIVKSNFFSHFGFAYTATNPFSFTLSHTHIYIYIFFGKSRLLRLAILLPDRKNKRQLKLYLKERKDIFFIFFLKFFIILSIAWVAEGLRGPPTPAVISTAAVFCCVDL